MVYKRFTVEEKQAFATAYNGGATLKDLAAQAGVSIPTMAKYVRAGGGAVRRPGNPKNPIKGSKPGWPMPERQLVEQNPPINTPEVFQTTCVDDGKGGCTFPEVAPARKIMSF